MVDKWLIEAREHTLSKKLVNRQILCFRVLGKKNTAGINDVLVIEGSTRESTGHAYSSI